MIGKLVKLKKPELGEEDIIFKIVNFNEKTNRVYIEAINMDLPIPPQELVSFDDVELI